MVGYLLRYGSRIKTETENGTVFQPQIVEMVQWYSKLKGDKFGRSVAIQNFHSYKI